MTPVRVQPEGQVHYVDPGEPVRITLRLSRPSLSYQVDGFVIAWTRNAVLAVWENDAESGPEIRSGWLPPADVVRKRPRPT